MFSDVNVHLFYWSGKFNNETHSMFCFQDNEVLFEAEKCLGLIYWCCVSGTRITS